LTAGKFVLLLEIRMNRLPGVLIFALLTVVTDGWSQVSFALSDVKPHVLQMHRAREAGVMDSVEVRIGDSVGEGQILARLEHDRQLHAYHVAKAKAENKGGLTIAEGELQEKNAALEEMNMKYRRRQVSAAQVSQSQGQAKAAQGRLEQAKMNAELAELELALAEKLLERRFIRCTFKGTVVEIARNPGDRTAEGDVVVTVADLSWMTAVIPMTKESAAALAGNAAFPVKMAGSSVTRMAQVVGVTPMPHGTKGEQMVQIAFANSDPFFLFKQKAYEVLLPANLKTAPLAKQAPPPPAKSDAAKKTPGRT
jgi:multidrug efflux pump subunit AcrA (membrane-fusion protein)